MIETIYTLGNTDYTLHTNNPISDSQIKKDLETMNDCIIKLKDNKEHGDKMITPIKFGCGGELHFFFLNGKTDIVCNFDGYWYDIFTILCDLRGVKIQHFDDYERMYHSM